MQHLGGGLQEAQPCRESISHAHDEVQTGEYEKDEVGRLREEARMLQQQLAEVMRRLDRLQAS